MPFTQPSGPPAFWITIMSMPFRFSGRWKMVKEVVPGPVPKVSGIFGKLSSGTGELTPSGVTVRAVSH